MGPRLRRMKPYRPRRRIKNSDLHKQTLKDLEHKISADIGALVLLAEEGNQDQIAAAKLKAKSDYLKYGDEMQKIAQGLGARFTHAVRDFLSSVDTIVHSESGWIDKAKIHKCYTMTEKLLKELEAA